MNELKIEYLNPADLTPYEQNTRKHAPEDIEQIKKSILDDGFNDPIGIWGEKNIIVEGHGRQIAALELGLDKVPVIRLDHMTDDQRRDYGIRHNRTAELSAWDFGKLEEEIAALEIEGHDFTGLNFEFGDGNLFNYMNNDSFTDRGKYESDIFTVSLNFEKQYEEEVIEYIKENGKDALVEACLKVVNGDA